MKRIVSAVRLLLAVLPALAFGRGVSPYLPLNLEPEIERQIERVLILAGKPVMSRPIAAATVLDALPKACKIDPLLCSQVRGYLSRYMHKAGIAHASVEGATSSGTGSGSIAPNRYGMRSEQSLGRLGRTVYRAAERLPAGGSGRRRL